VAKWGDTTLNIVYGTYDGFSCESGIVESMLIPNSSDLTAVSSMLQQGGRTRERATMEVGVKDIATYNALKADSVAGTERTFISPLGNSFTCIIEKPGTPKYVNRGLIRFTMTLLEA
jgi:hypothetical protein